MSATLTIPPAVEPVTLSEVKQHLVIEVSEWDAQLLGIIKAARMDAEEMTRRAFITQTWALTLDCFSPEIELPKPPLQSISSIVYIDPDGVQQTVPSSDYEVDTAATVGKVRPIESWPDTKAVYNAVTITYVAGYGDTGASVPSPIRHGLLINISDLFEHRGAMTAGVGVQNTMIGDRMLGKYRVYSI